MTPKDIALKFLYSRNVKITKSNFYPALSAVKALLKDYSYSDLLYTIDRVENGKWRGKDIYSIAYFKYIIDEVLEERNNVSVVTQREEKKEKEIDNSGKIKEYKVKGSDEFNGLF